MPSCQCTRLGVWVHTDGTNSFNATEAATRTASAGPVVTTYAKPWLGCGYLRITPSCPPKMLAHRIDNNSLRELARYAQ